MVFLSSFDMQSFTTSVVCFYNYFYGKVVSSIVTYNGYSGLLWGTINLCMQDVVLKLFVEFQT